MFHVSKRNRPQWGFAPVVIKNQIGLECDTCIKIYKTTLWDYIILMGVTYLKILNEQEHSCKDGR